MLQATLEWIGGIDLGTWTLVLCALAASARTLLWAGGKGVSILGKIRWHREPGALAKLVLADLAEPDVKWVAGASEVYGRRCVVRLPHDGFDGHVMIGGECIDDALDRDLSMVLSAARLRAKELSQAAETARRQTLVDLMRGT